MTTGVKCWMRWLEEDGIALAIFGVGCQLGKIMNEVGHGDGSCVKTTEEG